MATIYRKAIITGLILCGLLPGLRAQIYTSRYELGLSLGSFIYQGDLSPQRLGSFRTPGWLVSADVSRQLSNTFSVRVGLTRGQLRGNDSAYALPAWRRQRNFNFHSPVTEVDASLVAYPIGHRHRLTPYVFSGPALSFVHIRRDYSRFNAEFFAGEQLPQRLQADAAHRLPRVLLVAPTGAGLRYALTPKWGLRTEVAYRFMHTDYLDGFSKAANPKLTDHYTSLSVGITYRMGVKNDYDCPAVR